MIAFSAQPVEHYPKSVVRFPQVFSPSAAGAVSVQSVPSLLYPIWPCFLHQTSPRVTFRQEARVYSSLLSSYLDSVDASEIDFIVAPR